MPDIEMTTEEKQLSARFTLEGSMHTWAPADKIKYLAYLNRRVGLPFGTIGLLRTESEDWKTKQVNIKEIPYASRQTTIELAELKQISLERRERIVTDMEAEYCYRATDIKTGRFVDATGSCALIGKNGNPLPAQQRSNKIMHAETKAKRRAALEICGLAFLDDSELESIEGATVVALDGAEAPKGNGAATAAPKGGQSKAVPVATATPASNVPPTATTPAATSDPKPASPAAPTGVVTNTATSQSNAVPTPAPQVPVAPAEPTPAPAPASTGEPVPQRYIGNPLFDGDDDTIVADKAHIDFIVAEATQKAGWASGDLTKWLLEAFGVRMANVKETLTLRTFKRIMAGVALGIANRAGGAA